MKRLWILVSCLMLCAPAGRADVAPEPLMTGGNNPSPRAKTEVAMEWEEVDLTMSAEKNETSAVFGLKNRGKEATEFEVGFPSYYKMPLEDFSVTIDGVKQMAEVKKEGQKNWKGYETFTYWMCWTMKFDPGQEHKVEVKYWVKPETGRELFMDDLPDELKPKIAMHSSGYVLRTGKDWAGKIGKATIRMHYSDAVTKGNLAGRSPEKGWSYDDKAKIDTLTLTDLEPDDSSDIHYSYYATSAKDRTNLLIDALKEKKIGPWSMEHLMDLLVKKNALGLGKEELAKKSAEVQEMMLPPLGKTFDQTKISPGAEDVLRKTFQRVVAMKEKTNDPAGLEKIASAYEKFLANMMERTAANKGVSGWAGNEYAKLEAEHAKVAKLVNAADLKKADTKP